MVNATAVYLRRAKARGRCLFFLGEASRVFNKPHDACVGVVFWPRLQFFARPALPAFLSFYR